MAQGQYASETIILNNKPTTTTTKTVELNVVSGGHLLPDQNVINHGVDSRFQ